MQLIHQILDWSEVWALLIPLAIFFWRRPLSAIVKPVIWYVCIAFILNLAEDYIWKNDITFSFSSQPGENNFIYNTHSILRLLLFSWFFIKLKQPFLFLIKKILPFLFLIFIILNFRINEYFTDFSSLTLGIEAAFLLVLCLIYFINLLQQDYVTMSNMPDFWVVTGLSVYVVINFPIFLFYKTLFEKFRETAIDVWVVHNITYIIFCLFIAKAFYEAHSPKHTVSTPFRRS